MVRIVQECAARNGVSNFDDLARLGVHPTKRQKQIVESASGNFVRIWARQFVGDKFGSSTTHWTKLLDRIDRGVGNPCPLLLIGIPATAVYKQKLEESE